MTTKLRTIAGCGAALLIAALFPFFVAAHEHRDVADGQYELTVGFLEEPAYVGLKNGLSLAVEEKTAAATPAADGEQPEGEPVEGLSDALTAEVIYGDQSMELELEPVFGDPGSYQAIFFPTATGDYSFRISGEIDGEAIDETFTSGPETFAEVEPIEPLMFPKE